MNYYNPNFYQGYNYGNNQYIPQYQQQPQQIQQVAATSVLSGKVVDSEDMVKATEVPIGGYSIFPKADLSEIYIKSWNQNGTTSIITFKPYEPPIPTQTESGNGAETAAILEKISALEGKLDEILQKQVQPAIETKGVTTNVF